MISINIYTYFILCLFPLLLSKDRYAHITFDKFHYFCISVVILIACIIVEWLIKRRKTKMLKKQHEKLNISHYLLFAYLIWCLISGFLSDYKTDVILGQARYEGLVSLFFYSAVFFILSRKGQYKISIVTGMAITGLIISLIAFSQEKGGTLFYPNGYTYFNSSFLATLGNIDIYAGFVSVYVPLLFAGIFLEKPNSKYIAVPAVLLLIITELISNVETGKIGMLVGIVFSLPYVVSELVYKFWKKPKIKRSTIRLIVFAVILFFIIVALIFVFTYKGGNRTLTEASKLLHGELSDEAGSGRGHIWKTALTIAKHYPVFGTGPGTFSAEYMRWTTFQSTTEFDLAHNDFLQIAACEGFVGLALYLAFIISVFVQGIKKGKNNNAVIILLSGAIGFLAYSAFVFSLAIVSPPFWALMGLALSEITKEKE